MFFVLSKIFWFVIQPINLAIIAGLTFFPALALGPIVEHLAR